MTLTVRPRGTLRPVDEQEPVFEVTAVVWTDQAEEGEGAATWGGIAEPAGAVDEVRTAVEARLAAGQLLYRLRLSDGREGLVELTPSEFEADSTHPFAFTGVGALRRIPPEST